MIAPVDLAFAGGFPVDYLRVWAATLADGAGYSTLRLPRRGRKKSRTVFRPAVGLDRLLKQLRVGLEISTNYSPHDAVHGFVNHRGILTNAAEHLDRDVVLRVDLRDFFGAVTTARVTAALISVGLAQETAELVSSVTTVHGALPQGFSTSPFISNVVFDQSDSAIAHLSVQHAVTYTRYADDLAFSGTRAAVDDNFLAAVSQVLADLGWEINDGKTRFMRRGRAQFVTGLSVSDASGPHVPRIMKRAVRQQLYFAQQFGLADARDNARRPMTGRQLRGWVDFIGHVEPRRHGELRQQWNEIAPPRALVDDEDWDSLLEEIDFPTGW